MSVHFLCFVTFLLYDIISPVHITNTVYFYYFILTEIHINKQIVVHNGHLFIIQMRFSFPWLFRWQYVVGPAQPHYSGLQRVVSIWWRHHGVNTALRASTATYICVFGMKNLGKYDDCSVFPPMGLLHDDVIKWKHFRVAGHLCGEFTGPRWIPHTKASDAELWCFLWSAPK